MRICSKCKQDKPLEQYYTYYHSVQKKYRTRRVCRTCRSEQAAAYKQVQKQKNMEWLQNSKVCSHCGERKDKETGYYKNRHQCIECVLILDNTRRREERKQELMENGGSERVAPQAGMWQDEYQEQHVKSFLYALGWSYSETNKLWFKTGVKNENGDWINPKTGEAVSKSIRGQLKTFRDEIDINTLPKLTIKNRTLKTPPDDIINAALYDFFINKMGKVAVCDKYHMAIYNLDRYIQLTYKLVKQQEVFTE